MSVRKTIFEAPKAPLRLTFSYPRNLSLAGDVASLVESVQSRYKDSDWDAKSDQSLFIRYLVDSHKDGNDDKVSIYIYIYVSAST